MDQQSLKLLVVDDEPDICTSVQAYFGKRGFRVTTTASGIEALSIIPVSRPDVVVLDITLKDLSGKDVLGKLRARDKETKVIVITGNLYPEKKIKEIVDLGVSAYLNKARFGLSELEEIIKKVTGQESVARRLEAEAEDSIAEKRRSRQDIIHDLTNIHAYIKNDCDIFCRNLKEGFYKSKTKEDLQELVRMSVEIMRNAVQKVKEAREIVEQIREAK